MTISKSMKIEEKNAPALLASVGHLIIEATLHQALESTTSHRQPREQTTVAMDRAPTSDGSLALRIEK